MIRRPLVIATSALSSLRDAMFGYSRGVVATNQVQPSFIERMFGKDVTMRQIQTTTTGVTQQECVQQRLIAAITVSCPNIIALLYS